MVSIIATNIGLGLLLLAVPLLGGDFLAWQLGLYLLYGIAAQGVALAWGQGGFLPLGNAVFFGLAAYLSAALLKVTAAGVLIGLVGLFLAACLMAGLAYGLAFLLFRGRSDSGPFFSLVTLALVLIVAQLAETTPQITGGFNGFTGYQPLGGMDPFSTLYYLIAGLVVLVTFALMVLQKLPAGLIMRALVGDERRVQLLGFASHRIKAWVFALSAFITALAGGLFASHQGIVTPQASGFVLSAEFVIWAAVGGRLHPLGPLAGAVLIGLLSAALRDSFIWWEVAVALLFLIVVLAAPGGLAELVLRPVARFLPTAGAATDRPARPAPPSRASHGQNQQLVIDRVGVRQGRVQILNDLDFTCPEQGILCVIGPNGAGKTSLLKAITGALPVQNGAVRLGENTISNRMVHLSLASGIGRKMQVPAIFSDLSLRENLCMAALAGRARLPDLFRRRTFDWQTPTLAALLAHPGVPLSQQQDRPAGALPQGHKQMLELALAIAPAPPVLLLDEPTAGMSPEETAIMVEIIHAYQQQTGAFVLVIEHDMALVEALQAEVLVLDQGRVLATGSLAALRANPAVRAVYAGGQK